MNMKSKKKTDIMLKLWFRFFWFPLFSFC